eukprot:4693917-Pyramimonas_sp.AAC.1
MTNKQTHEWSLILFVDAVVDVSPAKYAYDTEKLFIENEGDVRDWGAGVWQLCKKAQTSSTSLNIFLAQRGHQQNATKQSNLFFLVGPSAGLGRRALRRIERRSFKRPPILGSIHDVKRSLGGQLHYRGSAGAEIAKREEAITTSYLRAGAIWNLPGIPWRWRR